MSDRHFVNPTRTAAETSHRLRVNDETAVRMGSTDASCPENNLLGSCFFRILYANVPPMPRKPRKAPETLDETDVLTGETADDLDPSAGPARSRLPFETFVQTMAGIKEAEVPYLYIFRLKPQCDKTLSGRRYKYIDKLEHPLPSDLYGYLKMAHGGGEYQLMLNAKHRVPTAVADCLYEVPLTEAEPIIDIKELVRGNPLSEQLIRKWKKDGRVIENAAGELEWAAGAAASAATTAAAAGSNALTDRIMIKAVDRLFDGEKQSSTTELLAIMKEAREQAAAAGGGNDMLLTYVMKSLETSEKRNAELMRDLMERDRKQQPSGGLAETVQTLKTLSENFGIQTGAATSQHWAVALVEQLAKAAPPLIGTIMLMRGGLTPGGQPMQQQAPVPAAPGQAPAPPAPPADNPQMREIRRLAERVLAMLDEERPGDEFAFSMVDMMGRPIYDNLVQAGKETISATLRSFPDLAPAFDARAAKLETFLDEFVNAYKEDEPEDPPAAA